MSIPNQTSRSYPSSLETETRIAFWAGYRDGGRLHKVDKFLPYGYGMAGLYTIYRATQHPYLEYFLAQEAVPIIATVIGMRGFLAWWCWRTLTAVFTPSTVIFRNGRLSVTVETSDSFGFLTQPNQNRHIKNSRYFSGTHYVLMEHKGHGLILLANVFGELRARQIVSKLQGLKAQMKSLKRKE